MHKESDSKDDPCECKKCCEKEYHGILVKQCIYEVKISIGRLERLEKRIGLATPKPPTTMDKLREALTTGFTVKELEKYLKKCRRIQRSLSYSERIHGLKICEPIYFEGHFDDEEKYKKKYMEKKREEKMQRRREMWHGIKKTIRNVTGRIHQGLVLHKF
ncbi:unnamed protein product [Caenorhabditis brenneri]